MYTEIPLETMSIAEKVRCLEDGQVTVSSWRAAKSRLLEVES